MKKWIVIAGVVIMFYPGKAVAQSDEAQQLLLNVEKLTQLKKILNNMYQGYQVVSKGYNTVRDISKGNFNVHQTFLDGLMQISPAVIKYKRIVDIINYQSLIIKEYKSAFKRFTSSNLFNDKEMKYMGNVYNNLFEMSLKTWMNLL